MKKTWKGTIAGLAALGTVAVAPIAAHAAACGDLDNNGSVTLGDCVKVLEVVAGLRSASGVCGGSGYDNCADLFDDGAPGVGVSDAVVCLNVVNAQPTVYAPCTGVGIERCITPGSEVTISGTLGASQHWSNQCTYLIDGTTFVAAGNTVTIDPGTTVKGRKTASSPSSLIFLRDSRLVADGTAANPIVFTSDQTVGTRGKGDWGGLVLNGRSTANTPGGEGLAEGLSNIPFGGGANPVLNDTSGVLRFVRIEYAGKALTIDNELNLLTMNGVGAGTVLDHIATLYGLDDCHEWFGGNVNEKYSVSLACGDDGLDYQLGYTGKVQHALMQQQVCAVEGGSNGIEGDNNENGFDNLPRSSPTFCNLTLLGTKNQSNSLNSVACVDPGGEVGMLLRRGTAGRFVNVIAEDYRARGITLNDAATGNNACTGGGVLTNNLLVENALFFNVGASGQDYISGSGAGTCTTVNNFYNQLVSGHGVQPALATAGSPSGVSTAWPATDPRPIIGSLADTAPAADCSTIDGFFDNAGYIGGFEPGGTNWLTTPWVSFTVDGLS